MGVASMMVSLRVALVAIVALALSNAAFAQAEPKSPQKSRAAAAKTSKPAIGKVKTDTRIYLFRGLLNVFSFGMDTLQERLASMGFEAEVSGHNSWLPVASQIAEDRKRGHTGAVVLIGHSLGADVLFSLAERLDKENIPIRLVVFFDPTVSLEVPGNVEHALNIYQLKAFGRKVLASKGYKGELINHYVGDDESIGHTSIDKSEKLHDLVIEKIMKVAVGPVRKRPAPAKPRPTISAPPAAAPGPAAATPTPVPPESKTGAAAVPAPSASVTAAPSSLATTPDAASTPATPGRPPASGATPAGAAQVPRI
jgi:pimeloyl-ACP methyl ester carboxylesterase